MGIVVWRLRMGGGLGEELLLLLLLLGGLSGVGRRGGGEVRLTLLGGWLVWDVVGLVAVVAKFEFLSSSSLFFVPGLVWIRR